MTIMRRRNFLALAGSTLVPAHLKSAGVQPRIALVNSAHAKLARPASPDNALDYDGVRDMVWKAIEYAGGFAQRVRPGSWVVVKPNIVFLRPQSGYRAGDITDLRVTRAVLEYVALNSSAGRITIAEGGSYRSVRDPATDNAVTQAGTRVDARSFDWGSQEFPGTGSTLDNLLKEFERRFSAKRFDYVDLAYDALRDASGKFRRVEVPHTRRGIGAFGGRPDYFVTRTITQCDFLVSVPVMKVHDQCGITASLKNYVGTAPREAYAEPGKFWNVNLHGQHSAGDRIDPFIVDLAAFHPPDFTVIDGIRGLQYTEHNNNRPDQTIRSNLVMASSDPVAADALAAYLTGFNVNDIEFLHMAAAREMGSMDLDRTDVAGDDPSKFRRTWGKPRNWYGRCNREWRVTRNSETPMESWPRYTSPFDTLRFDQPGTHTAAVRIRSDQTRKAWLWLGLKGQVVAQLNGATVLEDENVTRYRIGQFQKAVELRSGDNLLVLRVTPVEGPAQVSALLVGHRNDGDSVEGIRWTI